MRNLGKPNERKWTELDAFPNERLFYKNGLSLVFADEEAEKRYAMATLKGDFDPKRPIYFFNEKVKLYPGIVLKSGIIPFLHVFSSSIFPSLMGFFGIKEPREIAWYEFFKTYNFYRLPKTGDDKGKIRYCFYVIDENGVEMYSVLMILLGTKGKILEIGFTDLD